MVGKVPFVDYQMSLGCFSVCAIAHFPLIFTENYCTFISNGLCRPILIFLFPKVEERVKEEDEVDTRKGKVIKFGWIEGVLMR